jgi:hypothetical protein
MKKIFSVVFTALLIFCNINIVLAADYYVDNVLGSNGNNGTSSSSPWFDFTNINSRTFVAGDRIFLKAGCTWNSELRLKGSGNSGNFIRLESYGSGNRPKIQRNSQINDRTVFMDNTSYWIVQNLEICNAGDGLRLTYTNKNYSSVYFNNLYIHNIDLIVNGSPLTSDGVYYSTGILIQGTSTTKPVSTSDYIARDIRITNSEIAYTTAPFTFLHVFNNPSGSNTESYLSFTDILVDNNYIHDHKGPMSTRDMNNSFITNNICKNGATVGLPQGTTGFFNFNIDNVVFEGNVMDGIPNTGSGDQCWIDNEAYCNDVRFFGNLIKNTAGPGIEFLALGNGANPPRGADDFNTNNLIDGNTFNSNSSALGVAGSGVPAFPSGTASNNVYLSGNTFFSGTSSGFTLTNNTASNQASSNLALYKSYSASSSWDNTQRASKAFDGSASTNWQSSGGQGFANQWLRINFGASTTFDKVVLSEYGNRTSGFRIEYSNDGINWQTAHTGTTIGNSSTISFSAVTGTMARLFFTSGSNTPIIYEFEIQTTSQSGGSNLASNKTYSSSSNWDGTQTADKGFDGNYSTNWQSANGQGFAGQWLRVNFGAATTFNQVKLFEYGNRTSGFRIEYSTDGSNWQTAYTGTTIGNSYTANFNAVTGSYARVYFTSGSNTPIIYEFEVYNAGGGSNSVNYLQNPGFEVDNASVQTPANWSTWTPDNTADADYSQTGNQRSGNWNLAHWRNGGYNVFTYQTVTGLANGTYTATVYARTIGTPSQCLIKAQDFGGTALTTNISGSAYTKYTISNIQVTNGQCIIGVYTSGNQNSAAVFDDFTLSNNINPFVNRAAPIRPLVIEATVQSTVKGVYPNPANNEVTVRYILSPNTSSSVTIFSIEGKMVKQILFTSSDNGIGKVNIDVADLQSGTYLIKVSAGSKSTSTKLIINK